MERFSAKPADLRKLMNADARDILASFGVPTATSAKWKRPLLLCLVREYATDLLASLDEPLDDPRTKWARKFE